MEQVLNNPEQIVPGDQDTLVAQARRGNGLLRVPFVEVEGKRKVLTLYWSESSIGQRLSSKKTHK